MKKNKRRIEKSTMNQLTKLFTLVLLVALSSTVFAKRPALSYDYISFGGSNGDQKIPVKIELEDNEIDIDGFFLNGSKSIADNIYINAGLYTGKSDKATFPLFGYAQTTIDYYRIKVGGGVNIEMSSAHHGIFQLNYEQESYSVSNKDFERLNVIDTNTQNGFSLKAGIRSLFADLFETGLYLEHVDTGESRTGAIIEARIRAASAGSIGLAATINETTTVSLDFRASF